MVMTGSFLTSSHIREKPSVTVCLNCCMEFWLTYRRSKKLSPLILRNRRDRPADGSQSLVGLNIMDTRTTALLSHPAWGHGSLYACTCLQ